MAPTLELYFSVGFERTLGIREHEREKNTFNLDFKALPGSTNLLPQHLLLS